MKNHIKNLFLLAAICLTVACKEQLYTGLTEKDSLIAQTVQRGIGYMQIGKTFKVS